MNKHFFMQLLLVIFTNFNCNSQKPLINFSNSFSSKIIAFGEASHGDKTVYQAREKLMNQLKNKSSEINILIEMPQGVTYLFNNYFNKKIDTTTFLNELKLYGLQTNSFLDFINKYSVDSNITFYGVDMQHKKSSVNHILNRLELFASNNEEEKYNLILTLSKLKINFNEQLRTTLNLDSTINNITNDIVKVEKYIVDNKSELDEQNDFWIDIRLPVNVLRQCFELAKLNHQNSSRYNYFRDSCMASNVMMIEKNTKGNILLLAANYHVSKHVGSMGNWLNSFYKDQYFSICTQYLCGKVLLVKKSKEWALEVIDLKPFKKGLPFKIDKFYNALKLDEFELFISGEKFKTQKIFEKKCYILDIGAYMNPEIQKSGYSFGAPNELYDAIYYKKIVKQSVRTIINHL